jgi:hypothetical protein
VALKSADKNSMVIFTKDGVTIAIDNDKKSIVIFRMSNMLSGFANNAASAKTNPSANAHHDSAANYQSLKTGNTKQICGYPAEEYVVTDNKGEKAHVWYVKVDFNAQLFYTMAASGMKGPGNSDNSPQNPFQKSMSNPNLLVGEVDAEKHPEHALTTESITKKEMVIATSGYNVRNMSNMSLQDMMQQKGK